MRNEEWEMSNEKWVMSNDKINEKYGSHKIGYADELENNIER